MLVHPFVRHTKSCPKHGDMQWKRCACPKSLYWHLRGTMRRVSARTNSWDEACLAARTLEEQLRKSTVNITESMTFVGTAVKSYLVDKRAQQLSPDTLKKLECIFYRLVDWCNQNNVSTLNELDVTKLREWRAGVSIYDVS